MSSENHQQWRERIANVQRQKMTPEQLERMKEAAVRQSRAVKARAQSYQMQKKSNGLRMKWASGITALSASVQKVSAPLSSAAYSERMQVAQEEMEAVSREMNDEEEEQALSDYVAMQNLAVSGEAALADEVGAREADDEVKAALEQLKTFPENDEEQETKFKVLPSLRSGNLTDH